MQRPLSESRLAQLRGDNIPGELLLLNEWGEEELAEHPLANCAVESMYLGKWEKNRVRSTDGEFWDFEEYARKSRGISRLGILRMDVDNLGLVFVRGLRFPERQAVRAPKGSPQSWELEGWGEVTRDEHGHIKRKSMASISRMAAVSRQLSYFFSAAVPKILEETPFSQCQVIYAGGDDLFIIGSWHQLPDLAQRIRSDFSRFCCGNPDFTISGGLTLIKGKYPIYRGAMLTGQAEEKAKKLRKVWKINRHPLHKDSFCFLGIPITWEDWQLAKELKSLLEHDIEAKKNKGFLAFLRQIAAENAIKTYYILQTQDVDLASAWAKIQYDRWRWLTAYQLRRRYASEDSLKKWSQILFCDDFGHQQTALPVYTWLELPVRWVEFASRKGGNKS
jgi:CRISPR-associated protein Csm1